MFYFLNYVFQEQAGCNIYFSYTVLRLTFLDTCKAGKNTLFHMSIHATRESSQRSNR